MSKLNVGQFFFILIIFGMSFGLTDSDAEASLTRCYHSLNSQSEAVWCKQSYEAYHEADSPRVPIEQNSCRTEWVEFKNNTNQTWNKNRIYLKKWNSPFGSSQKPSGYLTSDVSPGGIGRFELELCGNNNPTGWYLHRDKFNDFGVYNADTGTWLKNYDNGTPGNPVASQYGIPPNIANVWWHMEVEPAQVVTPSPGSTSTKTPTPVSSGSLDIYIIQLTVTNLDTGQTLSPGDEVPNGTRIRVEPTTANTGPSDAGQVLLHYYDNSTYIDDDKTSSLDSGDTDNESDTFDLNGIGSHTLKVIADPNNLIGETNENNNEATFVINVIGQSTATFTPTPTDTPTHTPTFTPHPTITPSPTDTPTFTPTPTHTPEPTHTPTPTNTPTDQPPDEPTHTPTNTPTNTPIPSDTPTPTNTPVPTDTPTLAPSPTLTGTTPPTETLVPTPVSTSTPTPTKTPSPTSTATNTPTPTNTPAQPEPTKYPPEIIEIEPIELYNSTTTVITITGNYFYGVPTVQIGQTIIHSIRVINLTQIEITVPTGFTPGVYDITLTNPDGQITVFPATLTIIGDTVVINEVRPNTGTALVENTIHIYGTNFQEWASVTIGNTLITNTTRFDEQHLIVIVPKGFAPGSYDITIVNPNRTSVTLTNGYTVISTSLNDDLFSYDYNLWTDPTSPQMGVSTKVGLEVCRRGGKNTLSDVKVEFYAEATDIPRFKVGEGVIPLFSPRSCASTFTVFGSDGQLPRAGSLTLEAIIDPDNTITEDTESNNTIRRNITILDGNNVGDRLAPRVDDFSINSRASNTDKGEVKLDAVAIDQGGGQVTHLRYIEYELNQVANVWIPVQDSGWLGYEKRRTNYNWSLVGNGLRIIQAWAADNNGNVSLFPFQQFINNIAGSQTLAQNDTHVYRYLLSQGDSLVAEVESLSGDADLYIWPPDYDTGRPPWVSNLGVPNTIDAFSLTAPVDGLYQVEVFGYNLTNYQITVDTTGQSQRLTSAQAGGVDPDKPVPGQPKLSLSNGPNRQALPAAPIDRSLTTQPNVYLPIVVK